MDADQSLRRLADAAGIEARYWDIHGIEHETTPETMRILLGGFGIAAGNDSEIAESLAGLEQEPWRRALPPVVIAREGEAIELPLRLPLEGGTIRWSVRLETGGLRNGECAPDSLHAEDIGHLGETRIALRRLKLEPLPTGYHEFRLEAAEETVTRLIVAPGRCHLPPGFYGRRRWGVGVQLYSLKSSSDWGIGDFGDLKLLVDRFAAAGADAIGLNPLHALFLDTPQDASPYSPSSRLFRNPLYLDVTAIPDFAESGEAREFAGAPDVARAVEAVRTADFVGYRSVANLKLAILEHLCRSFAAKHVADQRAAAFRAFVERSGETLERFATFQMLGEHFQTHDWQRWPAACQDWRSPLVTELGTRCAERVAFFKYLQWQSEEQFRAAAGLAQERGMAIGLYNDLAVSVDASSADHWSNRELFAGAVRIGAPPDPFNESGQEWGVVPLNPSRLRSSGYAHFAALMQANMRHSGALRIDHVMGWQRLFLIPAGARPTAGAYVRYPLEDLLAIASLESQRNRCMVIGEDLGTVPGGFRERLAAAQILSCRVFYFERDGERYRRPSEYPALAAVSLSTHDLATLRGFWEGQDVAAKAHLGLFKTSDEEAQARSSRAAEKRQLLEALAGEGLLPEGLSPADAGHLAWSERLARAMHAYLARTPSALLMVQLDDVAGEAHQTNLPGSTTQYPNWRRRLARTIEDVMGDPAIQNDTASFASERAK